MLSGHALYAILRILIAIIRYCLQLGTDLVAVPSILSLGNQEMMLDHVQEHVKKFRAFGKRMKVIDPLMNCVSFMA